MFARSIPCIQIQASPLRLALAIATLAVGATSPVAADTAVKKPDCAALEEWATGLDGKDHWKPLEGYGGWVPRDFQNPAFEELFGAPALDWSQEDANAMSGRIYACGKEAAKARRLDARNALYAARVYMRSNLRNVLKMKERLEVRAKQTEEREAAHQKKEAERRAQQVAAAKAQAEQRKREQDSALSKALEDLLAQPDSAELLGQLAMLRAVNFNDPQSYGQTYGRVGKAGRQLLFALRNAGSDTRDPRVAPQLEKRYTALRDATVTDYEKKITGLNNSTESLRFLDRYQREMGQQMAPLLGRDMAMQLLQLIADKRQSVRAGIFERAKALIDAAPDNATTDRAALKLIDKIVVNSAKAGLTSEQLSEVRDYAQAHQQTLADREIETATQELAGYPETLDGLDNLRRALQAVRQGPLGHASKEKLTGYLDKARSRLTDIAAAALPEFKGSLAKLPVSQEGLKMTGVTIVSKRGFRQVGEDVRVRYVAAVENRRATISQALQERAAATRQAAVESGGDPDLIGYRFVDEEHLSQLEFRDEKLVIIAIMGLRAAGNYQLSQDDVIIRGPNGTMVLARSGAGDGTHLSGMGLTFVRVSD
jgi:myosin heavy subunit